MYILMVHVQVKADSVEAFKAAITDNAENSRLEAGVERFDVLQQMDDPTRFTLVEVYHSPDDHAKHRETAHYLRWRDTVTDMMAGERTSTKYVNVSPSDADWNR